MQLGQHAVLTLPRCIPCQRVNWSTGQLTLRLTPRFGGVREVPLVGMADAFLEVYHLGPVRDEEEVLEWLRFVEAQCPECVLPEADWL